jgi:tRNA threonylcarbamoyladenosine biosynthesis protein TsaB
VLILTIETSTPVECVAVVQDREVVAELTDTVGRGHTEKLLGAVEEVLGRAGVTLADLDAIAVSIGPGRFSGLRVGLATAKGLAASSGTPVVPVPTLEALAESARPAPGLVCPMLDARKGEVYAALFRLNDVPEDGKDSGRERMLPDLAVSPAQMVERVAEVADGEPVVALGSGAVEYAAELSEGDVFDLQDRLPAQPTPEAMATFVEDAAAGALPDAGESLTLEPVYLRGI